MKIPLMRPLHPYEFLLPVLLVVLGVWGIAWCCSGCSYCCRPYCSPCPPMVLPVLPFVCAGTAHACVAYPSPCPCMSSCPFNILPNPASSLLINLGTNCHLLRVNSINFIDNMAYRSKYKLKLKVIPSMF